MKTVWVVMRGIEWEGESLDSVFREEIEAKLYAEEQEKKEYLANVYWYAVEVEVK